MNENVSHEEDVLEIDILELIYVLLRKWWLIAFVAILGAAVMMGFTTFFITPQYRSQAMLYILNKTTSVTSIADLQIGTELTEDFAVIATSKPVIDGAIESIKDDEGITFTRKEIQEMLEVSNKNGTRILNISATSENPVHACIVANAVANSTAFQMAQIMKSDPPTTVERAEVSEDPVEPNILKNTIIGFLVGAILVCGILVVQYILNDTIKTEDHITKYLGVPTLAVIPYVKGKERKKEELKKLKGRKHAK